MKKRFLRRLLTVSGLAFATAVAVASPWRGLDGTISVDRALNSPTLSVKYSGVNASLVELRVNGESIATRTVSQAKDSGETTFTIDLSTLRQGDNNVEIRLFDKSGRIVGTDKSIISTDDGSPAPFFLDTPKMGATVQGAIDISVGFNKTFTNSFVSFFIDNQLKTLSNTPPFTYLWDTTKETNGWHELESWLVDNSDTTYRTKKIRVFVNNPQGQTSRHSEPRQAANDSVPKVNDSVPKVTVKAKSEVVSPVAKPVDLSESIGVEPSKVVGVPNGLKPVKSMRAIATGPKILTPTGTRLATNYRPKVKTVHQIEPVVNAVHLLPVLKGTRFPNIPTFSILLNGSFVDFDVQPRVDDGVPMTPLRFLFERDGGKVAWHADDKSVTAQADGHDIFLHIGDSFAKIDRNSITMERPSYIDAGRTIVPLSFVHDALNVDVQYDKATGHVLITTIKK